MKMTEVQNVVNQLCVYRKSLVRQGIIQSGIFSKVIIARKMLWRLSDYIGLA